MLNEVYSTKGFQRMISRVLCNVSTFVLVSFLCSLSVVAQTGATGALTGTITDPAQAVVAGVQVKVTNTTSKETRTVVTSEDGIYNVPLLTPGDYTVEISKEGFKTVVNSGVKINVTETASLNVQLEIGDTAAVVNVESQQEIVQTETSTLGRTTEKREIENLPLVTRNYTQILGLSPGVTTSVTNASELGRGSGGTGGGAVGTKVVNGARPYDNNFEMNGVPVNDLFGGGARFSGADISGGVPIPNPDTLEQFKVQTGLYDASFGRNAGANVNVVTKGGSNDFHGTIFEYFRNEALNANDFFRNRAGQPRPVLRQNQFGFTLGGPIIKEKLLFFGSYQGTRQLNGAAAPCSSTVFSVPLTDDRSAAALGQLFAGRTGALGGVAIAANGSNINPIALRILQARGPNGQYLIPTPQTIDRSRPFNTQGFSAFSSPCSFDEDQFMTNGDYIQSDKSTFGVRFFFANSTQENTIPSGNIPYANKPIDNKYRNFSINHNYVFNSNLINEARFGVNYSDVLLGQVSPFKWSDFGVATPNQSVDLPGLIITGSYNLAASTAQDISSKSFNFNDSLSYTRGSHAMRFGGGFTRTLMNPKDFRQNNALTFQTFVDFLLGLPGGPVTSGGNGTAASNVFQSTNQTTIFDREYQSWYGFLYAQDNYKVTPRLTLNLGVRYERIAHITDALGRLSTFDINRANPNPPASGSLEGFIVTSDYAGGTVPAGVTQTDTRYPVEGKGQNNIAPRLGFAWQVLPDSSRVVLRGGYGLYFTQPTATFFFLSGLSQPWAQNQTNTGALFPQLTLANPYRTPFPDINALPAFVPYTQTSALSGITYVAPDYRPGRTHQISLNVQTELMRNLALEVGYVGSFGRNLNRSVNINQASLASASNPIRGITTNTVANVRQRARILGILPTGLNQIESAGESNYNALQTSLTKRFSNGFSFLAAYTFSKLLDTDAGSAAEGSVTPGNQLDPRARYGRSVYDRTHRFTVSYVYELPFFKNSTGLTRTLLGGWSVAGVTTIQSGTPLTLTANNPNNAYGITTDRVQLASGCTYSQLVNSTSGNDKTLNYFNRSCIGTFRIIGDDNLATDFGNSGVGIVNGPGQNNTDFVIAKRFRLGIINESSNLEFRTEIFNLFNTPQFANPVTNFSAANFGQITALSVNPRIIQFALKFNF